MKLFNIFNIFKKENKEDIKNISLDIKAPITGRVVNIKEVPDLTFSQKLLGDGLGIEPVSSGNIVSPVNGTIIQLFDTLHAFTVETDDNICILVHFGINTVKLKGEGFTKVLSEGDKVNAGDIVIKYDLDSISPKVESTITSIIVLDSEEYDKINTSLYENKDVIEGENTIISIES